MTKEDMDLFKVAMKCIEDYVSDIQTHSHRDIYNVLGGMYEPVLTCDVLKYPDFYGMNDAEHIVESVRAVIEACALLDRTMLTEYAKKMLDNVPKEIINERQRQTIIQRDHEIIQ